MPGVGTSRRDELPSRLSRRQFRRRRQARRAVPRARASAREAGGVPRDRHPRRRRASTISPAPRPARHRRVARRHRPPDAARRSTPPVRALLAPYLDAVAALNPAASSTTYPGSPALTQALLRPAGPADRLRTRAAAPPRRSNATLRRRRARQGDRDRRLDRAQRLCAAGGAARPRADRSAVRAAGRIRPAGAGARGGAPQMADRHLPALVSDQGRRPRSRPSPASLPGSASRKCCAWN